MDPVARAALSSWDWRPEIIVALLVLGVLFTTGWLRLRAISGQPKIWRSLGARWRPISYISGLLPGTGNICFKLPARAQTVGGEEEVAGTTGEDEPEVVPGDLSTSA